MTSLPAAGQLGEGVVCAVATDKALVEAGTVQAEGDLNSRGTLGVDNEASAGFKAIRLTFAFDTEADDEQFAILVRLA